MFLLCSQRRCNPVRLCKSNRVMRHVQMRHFEMYSHKCEPTQNVKNFIQIVKEQNESHIHDSSKLFLSAIRRVIPDSIRHYLDHPRSRPTKVGGARRDRTDDLLRARQALSQLSYGPSVRVGIFRLSRRWFATFSLLNERITNAENRKMVGLGRFELPTSPLSGVRSNQLSYRPKVSRCLNIVELRSRYVADFR